MRVGMNQLFLSVAQNPISLLVMLHFSILFYRAYVWLLFGQILTLFWGTMFAINGCPHKTRFCGACQTHPGCISLHKEQMVELKPSGLCSIPVTECDAHLEVICLWADGEGSGQLFSSSTGRTDQGARGQVMWLRSFQSNCKLCGATCHISLSLWDQLENARLSHQWIQQKAMSRAQKLEWNDTSVFFGWKSVKITKSFEFCLHVSLADSVSFWV